MAVNYLLPANSATDSGPFLPDQSEATLGSIMIVLALGFCCKPPFSIEEETLTIFYSFFALLSNELIVLGLAMRYLMTKARNRCCFAREITRKYLTSVA